MHFKSSEALADCTISIGAFADGETRGGAGTPFYHPVGAVERRGFNGQIVRFARGNRISITSQLLTFDVPIRETFSRARSSRKRKRWERGKEERVDDRYTTNLTNARVLLSS